MVIGKEKTNEIIDRIFKDCNTSRDCEYVDYNSDQIFLTTENKLSFIIWYKFTDYNMKWKLYKLKDMELLGEGEYDVKPYLPIA